jgi:hypothetical protein
MYKLAMLEQGALSWEITTVFCRDHKQTARASGLFTRGHNTTTTILTNILLYYNDGRIGASLTSIIPTAPSILRTQEPVPRQWRCGSTKVPSSLSTPPQPAMTYVNKLTCLSLQPTKKKTKLHGLSLRANYTDRATAACRQSDCQLVRIEGATWSA